MNSFRQFFFSSMPPCAQATVEQVGEWADRRETCETCVARPDRSDTLVAVSSPPGLQVCSGLSVLPILFSLSSEHLSTAHGPLATN
jgi:hypothetical protein